MRLNTKSIQFSFSTVLIPDLTNRFANSREKPPSKSRCTRVLNRKTEDKGQREWKQARCYLRKHRDRPRLCSQQTVRLSDKQGAITRNPGFGPGVRFSVWLSSIKVNEPAREINQLKAGNIRGTVCARCNDWITAV